LGPALEVFTTPQTGHGRARNGRERKCDSQSEEGAFASALRKLVVLNGLGEVVTETDAHDAKQDAGDFEKDQDGSLGEKHPGALLGGFYDFRLQGGRVSQLALEKQFAQARAMESRGTFV
jgi:hypothetical protein